MYKDTDSFVVCRIVVKTVKQISTGHVNSHNLTMSQYRLQSNAPLFVRLKRSKPVPP